MIPESVLLYGISSILSGLILVGIAFWTFNHLDEIGSRPFIGIMLSTGGWAVFNGANLLAQSHTWKIVFLHLTFICVFLIPVMWVVFSLQFTNNTQWWNRKLKLLTIGGSALFICVSVTNQFHFMYMSPRPVVTDPFPILQSQELSLEYPLYIVSYIWAYSVVIASNVLLMRFGLSSGKLHKNQIYLLSLGMSIPIVASVITALGMTSVPHLDLVPYGVGVWGLLVAYVFHRHRLFDVTPVARDRILSQLDDSMFVIDDKGRVTDWNVSAEKLFEQPPDGEKLSKVAPGTLLSALAKVGISVCDHEEGGAVSDGAGSVNEKLNNVSIEIEGSEKIFNIRVSEIDNGTSRTKAKAVFMRDITELEEKKNELESKKQELERQNERLDDFAGVLAHDLRSPLTVARGFTGRARETGKDSYFQRVEDAHERMDNMIDDLLMLARQGNEVTEKEAVSLDESVNQAWLLVNTPDGDLQVTTDQSVQANPSHLSNFFENLIRNTFDHVGEGSTVYVGDLEDTEGFFVADDGPGIPDDDRESIFEYGFTTESDGTGFGLSIVKETAEAHGWNLSLADDDEYGAKFEIRT